MDQNIPDERESVETGGKNGTFRLFSLTERPTEDFLQAYEIRAEAGRLSWMPTILSFGQTDASEVRPRPENLVGGVLRSSGYESRKTP